MIRGFLVHSNNFFVNVMLGSCDPLQLNPLLELEVRADALIKRSDEADRRVKKSAKKGDPQSLE
jgi:hypothetical protein